LETEVRELKDLLDEKDEKIDVLSRIHSFTSPVQKTRSPHQASSSPVAPFAANPPVMPKRRTPDSDGVIVVQHSASLMRKPTSDIPFTGPSSIRAFSGTLISTMAEHGKPASLVSTKALTALVPMTSHPQNQLPKTPPRLVSDQLINIFFQEWAPLYPVVHRPTILKAYDDYLTDPTSLRTSPYVAVQLNLIFGIAALSSKVSLFHRVLLLLAHGS
jgi:hypothetical protein